MSAGARLVSMTEIERLREAIVQKISGDPAKASRLLTDYLSRGRRSGGPKR